MSNTSYADLANILKTTRMERQNRKINLLLLKVYFNTEKNFAHYII